MSSAQPKYKAKPVFWDIKNQRVIDSTDINQYRIKFRLKLPHYIRRFDSQHEFKVYLELLRMHGVERVESQFPVIVIPSSYCYPSGKSWKIDFAIKSDCRWGGYSHFVEAKGAFLPEFAHTLASFEYRHDSKFMKLIIVFPNAIPLNNRVIKALSNSPFKKNLLTFEELKQLKTLP